MRIFTHEFTIFRMRESFVNSVTHIRLCVRRIYAHKLAYELLWIAPLATTGNILRIIQDANGWVIFDLTKSSCVLIYADMPSDAVIFNRLCDNDDDSDIQLHSVDPLASAVSWVMISVLVINTGETNMYVCMYVVSYTHLTLPTILRV